MVFGGSWSGRGSAQPEPGAAAKRCCPCPGGDRTRIPAAAGSRAAPEPRPSAGPPRARTFAGSRSPGAKRRAGSPEVAGSKPAPSGEEPTRDLEVLLGDTALRYRPPVNGVRTAQSEACISGHRCDRGTLHSAPLNACIYLGFISRHCFIFIFLFPVRTGTAARRRGQQPSGCFYPRHPAEVTPPKSAARNGRDDGAC